MVEKLYVTYNDVHKLCQESAEQILNDFNPNFMVAIGGGGYVPARILRSFVKKPGAKNIPIQAIGLSLYEELGEVENDSAPETPGTQVKRTQWLDFSSLTTASLVGKNVLIVDEVDDTRTTLEYALRELQKDVRAVYAREGISESEVKTNFAIFVLHNKQKPKKGHLPDELMSGGGGSGYLAARNVGDVWINYPWEAMDIEEHDRLASLQK